MAPLRQVAVRRCRGYRRWTAGPSRERALQRVELRAVEARQLAVPASAARNLRCRAPLAPLARRA